MCWNWPFTGVKIVHPKVRAGLYFQVFIFGCWNFGTFSSDFFSFLSKIREKSLGKSGKVEIFEIQGQRRR